jgi:phage gp45-like
VKLKSPDYKDIPQEEAVSDFLSRIHLYEQRYETIDDKTHEKNYSFIKIFNCGERFLVHKIGGDAHRQPTISRQLISVSLFR